MNDEYKTREELLREISQLRSQAADLKKTASRLDHTENTLKMCELVLATVRDPMSLIGKDYKFQLVNAACLKVFKKRHKETLGHHVAEVFGKDIFEHEIKKYMDECLRGKDVHYQVWLDFIGTGPRCYDVMYYPLHGPGQSVEGIVTSARDITESKLLENTLRESEEKYATVVENARDGVIIIQDYLCKFANEATKALTGYSAAELAEKPFWELFTADYSPLIKDRYEMRLAGKQIPPIYETKIQSKDGTVKIAEVSFSLVTYKGKPADMGFIRDITRRRKNEAALKEYSEKLELMVDERTKALGEAQEKLIRKEKLAILGQLSGAVGHELRNPLGVMSNAVYFLNMVLADADDIVKEYLGIISSEIRVAEEIVSDLLDFSRVKLPERLQLPVTDLVIEAIERYTPPENIQVITELDTDLPAVFADPRQMDQVFYNLITNAYQAMPEGGTLTIRGQEANGQVRLILSDTGCGISEEHLPKLFEPLFTTKARGIGLGLGITKNLLISNGGSITVESQEGAGSTFTIFLPTREAQV